MVPSDPLPSFVDRGVAALVELDAVSVDAPLEGRHDPSTPVGYASSAREHHLAVVGPIRVAHRDAGRVEAGVTVEALVAG